MTSIRTYSISSTEDEVRPKNIIIVRRNVNAYETLCKTSKEHCEFCDQTFNNNFTCIKHNASHIIIPLVKQQVHQCTQCLFYFTSINDLTRHTALKHPVETNNTKEQEPVVKIEPTYCDYDNDAKSERFCEESVVKNEPFVDNVNYDIKMEEESFNSYNDYHSKALQIVNSLKFDSFFNNGLINGDNSNGMKLNDKLKFEDDFDLELGKEANVFNGLATATVDLKHKEDDSIHYDDLIAPGLYSCKRCKKKFSNRYKLIIHESVHVRINRKGPYYSLCQLCDKYIAGHHHKLILHLQAKHNVSYKDYKQDRESSLSLSRCEKCNLKFVNSIKHEKHFHPDRYSPVDFKSLATETIEVGTTEPIEMKTTECQPNLKSRRFEKIKEICEDCVFFFDKWTKSRYVLSGVKEEFGMRFPCDMCKKMCFHLKIITIKGLRHKVDEMPKSEAQTVKKKGIKKTNKDRLKNIQNRLKNKNYVKKF